MIKYLLYLIILIAVFALGFMLSGQLNSLFKIETRTEEEAEVLLEKIETVSKLVTVEGYYSEMYNFKEYWGYDWSLFRKKAMIRVKAKVSAGFDLSRMEFEVRPEEGVLLIKNVPENPEILSIEHDLDYYDLKEGTFNTFSEEDYNTINANAKEFIRSKAKESDLLDEAIAQGNEVLDLIQYMAESAGYRVEFVGSSMPFATPLLQ